jgi:uncharacterized protein YjiS (DUF1127 family)
MDTGFPFPKYKRRFYPAILTVRNVASWIARATGLLNRFTHRQALERLEHLNDRALRDIGLWREPGSRVDEWWMNPPP